MADDVGAERSRSTNKASGPSQVSRFTKSVAVNPPYTELRDKHPEIPEATTLTIASKNAYLTLDSYGLAFDAEHVRVFAALLHPSKSKASRIAEAGGLCGMPASAEVSDERSFVNAYIGNQPGAITPINNKRQHTIESYDETQQGEVGRLPSRDRGDGTHMSSTPAASAAEIVPFGRDDPVLVVYPPGEDPAIPTRHGLSEWVGYVVGAEHPAAYRVYAPDCQQYFRVRNTWCYPIAAQREGGSGYGAIDRSGLTRFAIRNKGEQETQQENRADERIKAQAPSIERAESSKGKATEQHVPATFLAGTGFKEGLAQEIVKEERDSHSEVESWAVWLPILEQEFGKDSPQVKQWHDHKPMSK